jgi:hypothetical protein
MPFTLLSGQSFSFQRVFFFFFSQNWDEDFDEVLYMAAAAGREASIGSSPATIYVVGWSAV